MLIYLSILDTYEEKDKFEMIYVNYKHTMFYVANDILKDTYLAEDAVHESFIKVTKNLHKISEVICPQTKSFLVTIVRNVSLTMLKNIKKENDILDKNIDVQNIVFDDNIFSNIKCELITDEILKLPLIYREVLYLECINEMSCKEISKLLNIPNETIKKRLQRGKKLLIVNLKKEGILND